MVKKTVVLIKTAKMMGQGQDTSKRPLKCYVHPSFCLRNVELATFYLYQIISVVTTVKSLLVTNLNSDAYVKQTGYQLIQMPLLKSVGYLRFQNVDVRIRLLCHIKTKYI